MRLFRRQPRHQPSSLTELQRRHIRTSWLAPNPCERVMTFPFIELPDAVEQPGEDITKGFDAVLCYPSYSTGWIALSVNSKCDWLSFRDINFLVNMLSVVMDMRRAWAHVLYCAPVQNLVRVVHKWDRNMVYPIKEEDMRMLDDPPTQRIKMFQVNENALHDLR